jgi:hypothetical protein
LNKKPLHFGVYFTPFLDYARDENPLQKEAGSVCLDFLAKIQT